MRIRSKYPGLPAWGKPGDPRVPFVQGRAKAAEDTGALVMAGLGSRRADGRRTCLDVLGSPQEKGGRKALSVRASGMGESP